MYNMNQFSLIRAHTLYTQYIGSNEDAKVALDTEDSNEDSAADDRSNKERNREIKDNIIPADVDVHIENTQIDSCLRWGITLDSPLIKNALIKNCKIGNCQMVGINCTYGNVFLVNNELYRSKWAGVNVTKECNVYMWKNKIHDNTSYGVLARSPTARVKLIENKIIALDHICLGGMTFSCTKHSPYPL